MAVCAQARMAEVPKGRNRRFSLYPHGPPAFGDG